MLDYNLVMVLKCPLMVLVLVTCNLVLVTCNLVLVTCNLVLVTFNLVLDNKVYLVVNSYLNTVRVVAHQQA